MYMLEIIDPGLNETIHFSSRAKLLDYIYMVEGEGLIPEIRSEYQRTAPTVDIIDRLSMSNAVYSWTAGRVRYVLSHTRWPWVGGVHVRYCSVPQSQHYHMNVQYGLISEVADNA